MPLGTRHYQRNVWRIADCVCVAFCHSSRPTDLSGAVAVLYPNVGPHSTIDHPPILAAATWISAQRYIGTSRRQIRRRGTLLLPTFPAQPPPIIAIVKAFHQPGSDWVAIVIMLGNDRVDAQAPRLIVLDERKGDTIPAGPCPGRIVPSATLPVVAFSQRRQSFSPFGCRNIDIKHDPSCATAIGSGKVVGIGLAGVLCL